MSKKEIIEIIDSYIEVLEKDINYYYNIEFYLLTEDQKHILDIRVMQKFILEQLKDEFREG